MRVSKLTNVSNENISVRLYGGPIIVLEPRSSICNVEVENINSIRGQVEVKEDLTEIGGSHGSKTRIDESSKG